MPCQGFVRRLVSVERRTAREALLDDVLGEDFEPWSFARCSSATEDAPQAAPKEEVLDEERRSNSIRKLSLEFESGELSEILAASAAPPPPIRKSVRGSPTCSVYALRKEKDPHEEHCAWGSLAERYKFPQPASPSPNSDDAARSPATSSFSADASGAGTFQSMPAQRQGSFGDLHLSVGEDYFVEEDDASFLL
jgi:hypothetical protein